MSVMTREQVDQLLEHADDCIRRALARLDVQGGPGVTVQGNLISVDMPEVIDAPRPAETWVLGLYASLISTSSLTGETEEPLQLAAYVVRATGHLMTTSIWEHSQIIQATPEGEESVPYTRSVLMEFFARTYEPGESADFEGAIYRFPVRIIIEEVEDTPGSDPVVVREHDLTVPRTGVSKNFLPGGEQNNILQLKSITRI